MDRSRSFVAEMFHIAEPSSIKKWSSNDMELLQKLGISPNDEGGDGGQSDRRKLRVSSNLHPDLKQHAYEEQINSLSTELQQTKKNLMRAAEYGQHLVEENSSLEATVLELRNDGAEYIAQLCELREENETLRVEAQSNEYSVTDYEQKMRRSRTDNEDLNEKVGDLRRRVEAAGNELVLEQSRCKLLEDESNKNEAKIRELEATYNRDVDELRTKVVVLQNTRHSLSMQRDEMQRSHELLAQQKQSLQSEYNELLSAFKKHLDGHSASSESPQKFSISRRNSHSRSRSRHREDIEEKMDEIMAANGSSSGSAAASDSPPEMSDYKATEFEDLEMAQKYAELLVDCRHFLQNIVSEGPSDCLHFKSPHKPPAAAQCRIEVSSFRDLLESAQHRLRSEDMKQNPYRQTPIKRDLFELRRNSRSAVSGHSHFLETLDRCVVSTDGEDADTAAVITDAAAVDSKYEADDEDLDEAAGRDGGAITKLLDDGQRRMVEQFLVRYSEDGAWSAVGGAGGAGEGRRRRYALEMEFNEGVTLKDKKRNRIEIGHDVALSLTHLIESAMDIQCAANGDERSFAVSMCGWFCGRSPNEDAGRFSERYSNILSALDFDGTDREETYWLIHQILSAVFKFSNHRRRAGPKQKDRASNVEAGDEEEDDDGRSDSDSASMVMTLSRSKYAELKPPARSRRGSRKSRANFNKISNATSSDNDSSDSQR